MKTVLLDTVGLLALWDESDQWHPAAELAFTKLVESRAKLITTAFILLETGNAASRRPYRNDVAQLGRELEHNKCVFFPTAEDWDTAWQAYERGEANRAGIIDQTSFIIMRRLGITQAFTNDQHFRAAGFEVLF